MTTYHLQIRLCSDTTFSRGDGVAGMLDREVEHDRYGLPFLHGRTLKGLLGEEVDNILDVLQAAGVDVAEDGWLAARDNLFGTAGSKHQSGAIVHYSHARLPEALRKTVAASLKRPGVVLQPQDVLASLTAVRRQTAVGGDGIPHDRSLRAMRVILRDTVFSAELTCLKPLEDKEKMLLAAGVLALRRAGTGRNRGRGRIKADLLNLSGISILQAAFYQFVEVLP